MTLRNNENTEWIQSDFKNEVQGPETVSKDQYAEFISNIEQAGHAPEGLFKEGITYAENAINNLLDKLRLEKPAWDGNEVIVIAMEDFSKIYEHTFNHPYSKDSYAMYISGFERVLVVEDSSAPEHKKVASVFHELIHAKLDRKIGVETIAPDGTIFSDHRRGGLHLSVGDKYEMGEFLNELGNTYAEAMFVQSLLNTPEFKDEKQHKIEHLKQNGFVNTKKQYLESIIEGADGKQYVVRTEPKNIQYDLNGSFILGLREMLAQLGSEIEYKVKDDNTSFLIEILRAKAYPEKQVVLKNLIDTKIGNGFYSRLKKVDYTIEGVAELLVELQSTNKKYSGNEA